MPPLLRLVPTGRFPIGSSGLSTVTGTPSPSPVPSGIPARPPAIPPVAGDSQVQRTLNLVLKGKMNATAGLTLTPGATSTVLTDSRIGKFSHVSLEPATAAAAAARPSLFIVPDTGFATIYHPAGVEADQTFSCLIIG